MKSAVIISRLPALSPQAFRDYYETIHAPLGMSLFPFEKYVRNYVLRADPAESTIDCLMTCTIDLVRAAAVMAVADAVVAADEARFMTRRGDGVGPSGTGFAADAQRAIPVALDELLVLGVAPALETPEIGKQFQLLSLRNGAEGAARAALADWATAAFAAGGIDHLALDFVVPGQDELRFPSDVLVTAWYRGGAPGWPKLPTAFHRDATLDVTPHETPPATLAASFRNGSSG